MSDQTCNQERQSLRLAYPRTCQECGLGPCKKPARAGQTEPIQHLPDVLTVKIARMPDGWWKVTAPAHHVGLYMVGRDLSALISGVPEALGGLLALDGQVPHVP